MALPKTEILGHYGSVDPGDLEQIDCFMSMPPGDFVFKPDKDGDVILQLGRQNPNGRPAVRLLIRPDVSPAALKRLLEKIMARRLPGATVTLQCGGLARLDTEDPKGKA